MRILLLFLLIFSFNTSVFSQEYIPMLQDDNVWGLDEWGYTFDVGVSILSRDVMIIGEEIIDGITYKEISPFFCLWREENGVVYEYVEGGDDIIVLDFTLEVGDTFSIDFDTCFSSRSMYYDLTVIDVYEDFIAGENRKVIFFEDLFGDEEHWIEGIGSTGGIAPGQEYEDAGNYLVCFTKNGETTFFNGATMCDNTFLGLDDLSKDKVTLSPNPITTVAILKLPQSLPNASIKYYDLNGKLIQEAKIIDNEVLISKDDFVTGMYFYQVCNDTKVEHSGKFLVK